ncbi:hypothetical protein ACYOEI_36045, partial [Singulisphaera rosea]
MRPILAVVVVVLSVFSSTAKGLDKTPTDLDTTVARGLKFLATDAMEWKDEHDCVSCHHAGLVVWSLREAKHRGQAVNEPVLSELTRWIAKSGDGKTGVPRPAS